MKKKTWYLIRTASDRMGGDDSYSSMDEVELLSQVKSFLECPYLSFYKLMDKDDLIASKNALKNNKKKKYTVAMTCSGGTAIAGEYRAKSEEVALEAAKLEYGDKWTYYVLKTKETNADKSYTYKITIDDSQCAYEYEIRCDGEVSIHEIAEIVNKYLRSDQPLSAGKYIDLKK